jgi:hypothetical protein
MASLTPRIDKLEGGRNFIINGAFDFWQRGTSFTLSGNGVYTADRWRNLRTGSGTHIFSRDTDVPTAEQSGFRSQYSLKYLQSVAMTTGQNSILTKLEGTTYANLHAKKARLSFWVKASIAGIYAVAFTNEATTHNYVVEYTINAANTWEKKTCDVQFETADTGWAFDNTSGLILFWNLGNTTTTATPGVWQSTSVHSPNQTNLSQTLNATFFLSQVSLQVLDYTVNPTADIPFSRAGGSLDGELTLCQRYYEKSYELDVVPGTAGATSGRTVVTATAQTASIISLTDTVMFKTRKRTNSSLNVTLYNSSSGASGNWQYIQPGSGAANSLNVIVNLASAIGFELSQGSSPPTFPTTTTFVLLGQWTADSEL